MAEEAGAEEKSGKEARGFRGGGRMVQSPGSILKSCVHNLGSAGHEAVFLLLCCISGQKSTSEMEIVCLWWLP